MTDEQFDFLMAIDRYKKRTSGHSRPGPSMEVMKALGYRKVAEPQDLVSFRKADRVAEPSMWDRRIRVG